MSYKTSYTRLDYDINKEREPKYLDSLCVVPLWAILFEIFFMRKKM